MYARTGARWSEQALEHRIPSAHLTGYKWRNISDVSTAHHQTLNVNHSSRASVLCTPSVAIALCFPQGKQKFTLARAPPTFLQVPTSDFRKRNAPLFLRGTSTQSGLVDTLPSCSLPSHPILPWSAQDLGESRHQELRKQQGLIYKLFPQTAFGPHMVLRGKNHH